MIPRMAYSLPAEEAVNALEVLSGELKISSSVVCPAPNPITPGCPLAMRTLR